MGEEPETENATEMETQTEGASPEAGTELAAETEGGSENAASSGNENQTENGGAAGTLGELEASGGLPENIGPSWVFLPVVLLLAMLLICIGLFIRRFMILEKRKKASVQEIFAAIFEVLTVGGLPASYSLLTENLEDEILERFVWIQEPEPSPRTGDRSPHDLRAGDSHRRGAERGPEPLPGHLPSAWQRTEGHVEICLLSH